MGDRFGELLRQARTGAGLTQEQLADRSGVGVRTIGGLETGRRRDPRPATVRLLADALALSPDARARLLAAAVDGPAPPRPRNDLPGDTADFTGRTEEVEALLAGAAGQHTVLIDAIDGMAGVGKTTLAVHIAHRLTGRYPDGQLFLDLHGHSAREATEPAAALDTLLRALGVPGDRIPAGLDQRASLWRAELAGRRVLVVLDNAAGVAQVRPLLPGAAGCLALVTSRHRLAELAGGRSLSLDVLPEPTAIELFERLAGVHGQREAVAGLVRCCGLLPLAIRIAAARLRSRPAWTVEYLADRLRAGQPGVAAAFELSHRQLTGEQQHLFRLLGQHPGPDLDRHAAAALAGRPVAATEALLEELVDVHLLRQPAPGRYRFHDLVRQYARDLAADDGTALERLTAYYLHTAHAADRLLDPHREPLPLEPATTDSHLRGEAAALAWFDTEEANLAAVLRLATARGWWTRVWQLATALEVYHRRRGLLHGAVAVWRAGLAAAERLANPAARTHAHRLLGLASARVEDHRQAVHHLGQALDLAEGTGDRLAHAHTQHTLAWVHERQGEHTRALAHARAALTGYRGLGLPLREAQALNAVGWYHALLGELEPARNHCETALALLRAQDGATLDSLGYTLDSLGYIAHRTGRHTEARDHLRQALAVYRELGNTYEEANTLAKLADTHLALGEPGQAGQLWREALRRYRQQGRAADIQRVQAQLDRPPVAGL